ncbi:UNVERIFIED_CONTAM: Berberine bridge enzyme-like 8 [Sesamum calycinum]|uniref:Berberine bridge enzyme-like 8 n=1 Tax=Sesamum calycinum TaxID=2727403 RepID=A0AAW2JD84_9LAMI
MPQFPFRTLSTNLQSIVFSYQLFILLRPAVLHAKPEVQRLHHPKPQLILTALHVSHIQAAVVCAKAHGLQMRIRSGGHDFEGVSYASISNVPFLILDMFNLRAVNVSIEDETAWVEAGATLGEVYYRIAEKSNIHGFPGGMCPTVGVGGQISGGGFGNLIRKYGLAADNVIDATLVDANGRLLDRSSMGEDLFWAITGGGGSSFGVVLAYKIRLVRVPHTVTFAGIRMTNNMHNFTDTVYKYLQVVDKLDEDLYIKLAVDVVKDDQEGKKTIRGTYLTLFLGDSERLLGHMKENFPELGLSKADCIEVSWVESLIRWTNFPAETPTSVLLSRIHPAPVRMKRKSDFLKKPIPKKGLEFIFKKMKELETPILKFFPYGGMMNVIPASAKPFPHRAGNIALVEIATNWNETGAEAATYYINMTRKLYGYITPFVSESREAYLNYRDLDLGINHNAPNSYSEAASYGFKYFKNNFDKLVEIKSRVDPQDFFRNEQSIPIFPLTGSI